MKNDTGIHIRRELRGRYQAHAEAFTRRYADVSGLRLIETRFVSGESDFVNGMEVRESPDNGRTFGNFKDAYASYYQSVGETDEITYDNFETSVPDPVGKNMVTCGMIRYFVGGHNAADDRYWNYAEAGFCDHSYLVYRRPDGSVHRQLIRFEDGADYDPDHPLNPDYLNHNWAYFGSVHAANNGDLLIPIAANVKACCRILGLDVNEVFPSCPEIMCGVILARAHWLENEERYEITCSKPVVISDCQSSRGVCEPIACQLPSGRILIVFRGSNVTSENWHTRISPFAPGFKWFCYSDDGGKTFTPAMPWHFDSREVVPSSATISDFFRSSKNGKMYWIGNVTDPTKTYGNDPRYPLQICEVDEKFGCLKKATLTEIDTRREGESDQVQLSNFNLLENRETGELEIRLAKIGIAESDNPWEISEAWTYYADFSSEDESK